ncbi:putative inactive receptor kinase [Cocos nucifera]|uniref:Putative inactive receptor kinase n=1 Tax=Cocos nucifera TaxID=13894 RepID=A0A8K0I8R2_COCNU|nr:putative inactive receptor kinase [Cocos nucifera]
MLPITIARKILPHALNMLSPPPLLLLLLTFNHAIGGVPNDTSYIDEQHGGVPNDTSYIVDEQHALLAFRQAFRRLLDEPSWKGKACLSHNSTWHGISCLNNHVTAIDLPNFGLSGQLDDPLVLANLTELTVLSLRNNSIQGAMLDFSFNLELTSIDFSTNMLSGPISDSLLYLDSLESLQLDHNMLSGAIPPLNQSSLKALNLSYNYYLTGKIPQTATLQAFNESSYLGNPDLCGEPGPISCQDHQKNKGNLFSSRLILAVFVFLCVTMLIFLARNIYVYCMKPKEREVVVKEKSFQLDFSGLDANRENLTSEERREVVKEVTKKITFVRAGGGFDLDNLLKASADGLGKGSFGSCYKVILDDARSIVVKRLKELSPLSSEEFSTHMRALGAMEHPNLLPLIGYYFSQDEKLLFSNFAQLGNLFDRIHGGRKEPNRIPFKWRSRLSVAHGVARAMKYLHVNTKGSTAIPHGNLKSTNVLLDENDVALVCDYGLASLVPPSLAVRRMVSYKSPDYQHQRKISKKTDIWSYGCLLLELLTGKISVDSAPEGIKGVELCHWVHRAVREEWTAEVFDAEIAEDRSAWKGMVRLMEIGLRCIEISPDKRPEMWEVVREVEVILASNFDSGEYSTDRSFVKGNGASSDPRKVLEILTQRKTDELKLIRQTYRALYNHDLLHVFSLRDNPFSRVAYLHASEPPERDAEIVRGALFARSLDTDTLTEIICTRSSLELSSAKQAYQARYNSNLERDVSSKTIGNLKQILLAILNSNFYDGGRVDTSMAMCDAKTLYEAIESGKYIDQRCIILIISQRSTSQIKAILSSYKHLYGHEFMKFLKKEKCGDFGRQLRIVIRCIQFPEKHFAKQLQRKLKNGDAREVLIQTVVTRSEIDIKHINSAFATKTGWTLESLIRNEFNSNSCSNTDEVYSLAGDFLIALLKHS